LERESESRQAIECARQVVDGVVRDGKRAVTTLVAHLEPIVDHVLLAHLYVVREPSAVQRLAPAALVQRIFGVYQLTLVLEQPLDAVERSAAFLVGCERDDDVAIGLESLALVANQIRDPERRLRL